MYKFKSTSAASEIKFKYRRIIHYWLIVIVVLLQLSALIVWYNGDNNESEMSKSLDAVSSLNQMSDYTGKIRDSFLKSQVDFDSYLINKDQRSLHNYESSLNEMNGFIESLRVISRNNKEFTQLLKLKKDSELDILNLKSTIDSILENQTNNSVFNPLTGFKLNKFEYRKILDSIKTDSYVKVDSVQKKGLFSRIGAAVAGKVDVQKEQFNVTVTMLFNNKMVSGSIEEQIENVFKTTNSYYENQFKSLKNSYLNLKDQDLKLKKLNSSLLKLQSAILPAYSNSINSLEKRYKLNMDENLIQQKRTRNYAIVILLILMLIISVILFSFTKLAFEYERRLTEAKGEILQSLNFKNRIIGMISHEIRSPLSIISIYSKIISSSVKDPEIQQTFRSIQFTTNSLILLSNQILEYSKDESHNSKLKNKVFELKSELSNIITAMTSLAESKGNMIKYHSTLESDIVVNADATKIHQLFYNIIGNANKFTDNGLIDVVLKDEMTTDKTMNLKVEISDNGTGISEQDLKNIFDLYYQGDNSDKINLGVGLGLNLCKEIVQLFNGKITVKSKEGYGTSIAFNLILNIV